MQLRDYQVRCLDAIKTGYEKNELNQLVVSATASGKCLGKDTPVLMYNGVTKLVQDINTGDWLMGPDSLPRRVLSTTSGKSELYKVTPEKGDSYVVNNEHILCLKITDVRAGLKYINNSIIDMSVKEYLSKDNAFKRYTKGVRTGVEFAQCSCKSDPYLVGLYLGSDVQEVPAEVQSTARPKASSDVLGVFEKKKPSATSLKSALTNKYIPFEYKVNERSVQLEVLAGILDSGGYFSGNSCDIIVSSKQLAEDIAFMSRSLGLAAYVFSYQKECASTYSWKNYFRVSISGNVDEIPNRAARKVSISLPKTKDVLVTEIRVKPIGKGRYYGFTLDQDGRFLLGDFTITHNTVTFSSLKNHLGLKDTVLVLVHLDFLLKQAMDSWMVVNPNDKIGLEQGTNRIDKAGEYDAIFASVQSLRGKRLEELTKRRFSAVIYDETHHIASPTALHIVKTLGLYPTDRTSDALLIGFTASPDRSDKKDLAEVLPYLAFEYDHWSALKAGWWTPVHAERVLTLADLSVIDVRAGDFVQSQLDDVLIDDKRTQTLYNAWLSKDGPRGRTIIFSSSLEYAAHLQKSWQARGHENVLYLDGTTKDRESVLQSFKDVEGSVLVNRQILAEGVDVPSITHIIFASPISSGIALVQMLGRGCRLFEGKEKLHVLYSVDKTNAKIKLKSPATLLGLPSSFDLQGLELLHCKDKLEELISESPTSLRSLVESGRIPDTFDELEQALRDLGGYCPTDLQGPLKGHTNLSWVISDLEALISGDLKNAEEFIINVPAPLRPGTGESRDQRQVQLRWLESTWVCRFIGPTPEKSKVQTQLRGLRLRLKEETLDWKKARLWQEVKGLRERESNMPDMLLQEKDLGRDLFAALKRIDAAICKRMSSSLRIISLDAPWRKTAPTEPQIKLCKRLRIPVPDNINKGDLTLLIDHHMRNKKQ